MLPQELQEENRPDLRKLLHFTLALVSELQPKEVLRRIAETACMLVGARGGALAISLPRGQKELIEVTADLGGENGTAGAHMPGDPAGWPATGFLAVPIRSRRGFTGTIFLTERRDGRSFTDEDEELIRSFAGVAAAVIDNAQLSREARQRELWVALHGEITTALLAGVSFVNVLDLVIRGARELTGADVATLCLPDNPASLVLSASDGRGAERLLGTAVPLAGSVSGDVVRTGEPVILTDAPSDPRRDEPILAMGGIETAMVVPLTLQGHTTGALAVGRSAGSGPLTQTDFWLLESFAAEISIALEYGRARTELERLARLDDQERIARDLHDTVIQQLFATGMSLQATAQRIKDPALSDRVQQAIDTLDTTIRDIRSTVFALRAPAHGGTLRHSLLALAEQLQEPHEFKTHMTFDGPVDTALDGDQEAHLIATLQEALSNVARHARARRVDVLLQVGVEVILRVADDGVGIGGRPLRMSGLKNLRARAQDLGGTMTVSTPPAGGTVLEWRVPLTDPEAPGHGAPAATPWPARRSGFGLGDDRHLEPDALAAARPDHAPVRGQGVDQEQARPA